jgi:hypothetical protein
MSSKEYFNYFFQNYIFKILLVQEFRLSKSFQALPASHLHFLG